MGSCKTFEKLEERQDPAGACVTCQLTENVIMVDEAGKSIERKEAAASGRR